MSAFVMSRDPSDDVPLPNSGIGVAVFGRWTRDNVASPIGSDLGLNLEKKRNYGR